jgi:hypothetical protein
MSNPKHLASAVALLFLAFPIFAEPPAASSALQASPPAQVPTARPPHVVGRRPGHPRREPCWEQAGISKGALRQRRNIQRSARAQIESVCANSSLNPQQRRQEIRAIHERTRQQEEALVTPQQREAMRACQEARNESHPGGGGIHTGGGGNEGGPCGELAEPKEPSSETQP